MRNSRLSIFLCILETGISLNTSIHSILLEPCRRRGNCKPTPVSLYEARGVYKNISQYSHSTTGQQQTRDRRSDVTCASPSPPQRKRDTMSCLLATKRIHYCFAGRQNTPSPRSPLSHSTLRLRSAWNDPEVELDPGPASHPLIHFPALL